MRKSVTRVLQLVVLVGVTVLTLETTGRATSCDEWCAGAAQGFCTGRGCGSWTSSCQSTGGGGCRAIVQCFEC